MKRILPLLLACLFLFGCAAPQTQDPTTGVTTPAVTKPVVSGVDAPVPYATRFQQEVHILLSDAGIQVDGGGETDAVYTSHDIIYYEDRTTYDSGNPYGEGEASDRHSAQEAAEHTVVNITAPGAYRVTGKLSKGQIRIDLGEAAYDDPNAVVELILENADITCTVAPAILFQNVYECDGNWSAETAKPAVDTTQAGAKLILEGSNTVTGSHVAKIFKDKEGEKKLWKQDGAIYSYMSMNVYGPGSLALTADNEGMDTELHLTINGGDIAIRSQNDGINTNEDGVSVTTINGGNVHIIAGLGTEGDGIDSNGYLVINGGTVVASANPMLDAGLDSDLGSFINGGLVAAFGSVMDWPETDSRQVTMNLQFAAYQKNTTALAVTRPDGTVVFAYDPNADEVLGENRRRFQGAILSCPNFQVGESYHVYLDGVLTGEEMDGLYDVTTVTAYAPGIQLQYTGTDVRHHPDDKEGKRPDKKEEGFPGGEKPSMPEGERPAEPGGNPGGDKIPEDGMAPGGLLPGWNTQSSTEFFLQDMVNFFSGLTAAK